MSNYPDSIDSFRVNENIPTVVYNGSKTHIFYAEDMNELRDAVVAVEETLGMNPEGAYSEVAARFDAIETAIDDIPLPPPALPVNTGVYIPFVPPGVGAAVGATATSIRAVPFRIDHETDIDRLAIYCTTAVASSTVRFGIYAYGANGRPGALILDAGTASTTSIGAKEVTVSLTLQPGWYFYAITSNTGTPGFFGASSGIPGMVYTSSLQGTSTSHIAGATTSGTMLNPFPTTTTEGAAYPIMQYRKA